MMTDVYYLLLVNRDYVQADAMDRKEKTVKYYRNDPRLDWTSAENKLNLLL